METITQDLLMSLYSYDKDTGIFTRKSDNKQMQSIHKVKREIYFYINKKQVLAHRMAWLYEYGELPSNIDHINHIRNDNRICNLRNVSCSENAKNRMKQKNNSTGVQGVYYNKKNNKFIAQIKINNKVVYLGSFKDLETAMASRETAKMHYKFHNLHS